MLAAMNLLRADKFEKMVAFLHSPAERRVRTNNHVERANRAIRGDERARYSWRSAHSLERFLLLRVARCCGLGQRARGATPPTADAPPDQPAVPVGAALSGGD